MAVRLKAVILAAGRGSRMGALTAETPKPLLRVGGVLIIERIIRGLRDQDFREIVLVIGYLGEKIRAALSDGSRLGVHVDYIEQPVREGTARALLLTREAVGDDDVLLTFTDIFTDAENYGRMREGLGRDGASVVAGVRDVDDPWRGAAVYVDGEMRVERIVEKPAPGASATRWNSAGLYAFRPAIFEYLERVGRSARGEYEIADAVTAMLADGHKVVAQELTGHWRDLASPEDIAAAEAMPK